MLSILVDSIAKGMKIWTAEQEAAKLAERFVGVSQAKFARDHKVPGGASMVSQHIKGHRPISMDAAVTYSRGFGVPLWEISPRLAKQAGDAAEAMQSSEAKPADPAEPKKPLGNFDDPEYDDSGLAQLAADWPYIPHEQRKRILDSTHEPAAEVRRHLQKMLDDRLKGRGKA